MRAGDIGRQVRPHGYGSRAGGVSDSGVVLGAEIPHYYEMIQDLWAWGYTT